MTSTAMLGTAIRGDGRHDGIPRELFAAEPPEARGLRRDQVRLLVSAAGELRHVQFADLGAFLQAGDLVVVNNSATVPSAVDARRRDNRWAVVHVAGPAADGQWIVELRTADRRRVEDGRVSEVLDLPEGATLTLCAAHPHTTARAGSRLWRAWLRVQGDETTYLGRVARPITYDYVTDRWPLTYYQTIFSSVPGSAEMPSAGRPFTPAVVVDLVRRGVTLAPITLHAGLSSLERGESPQPERYEVPTSTARLVNATRAVGGRVIAIGTTVTRALETVADDNGRVGPGSGWTDLVLDARRPARVVTGLVTGWHEPEASHRSLLDAVAGSEMIAEAYHSATDHRYRWHEFGDSCLLLPEVG